MSNTLGLTKEKDEKTLQYLLRRCANKDIFNYQPQRTYISFIDQSDHWSLELGWNLNRERISANQINYKSGENELNSKVYSENTAL